MPNGDFHCVEHSGCIARITQVENDCKDQWTHIGNLGNKIQNTHEKIMTRMNVILGGIVVACVMLAINIIIIKI